MSLALGREMMAAIDPKVLARDALTGGGRVHLSMLVAAVLPVTELRNLARKFGVSPKGGYRMERAPAKVLAVALSEDERIEVLDAVCAELATQVSERPLPEEAVVAPSLEPVLKLREQELSQLREETEKARAAADRERRLEAERSRELELEQELTARLRSEVASLQRESAAAPAPGGLTDADQRVHDLERELEAASEFEEALRHRVAGQTARIRDLETEVDELDAKVPKGRRKKPPLPPEPDVFRVPHFASSFYKALESKDRRSVERGVRSVLQFCTVGPSFPGLEAKQIEGHSLWSLRASLKLRVLFTLRSDGDLDVLDLVDREDQGTALRRWKDRRSEGE